VRGALAGRVAIGLPPSVAKAMAVPLIREFRKRMPDATVSISEGLSVGMHEALVTGRLDIALLYNPQPSPELTTQPLMDEELLLIGPRPAKGKATAAALSLREVSALPLVIPSRPNAIRMVVETEMAGIGCKPEISLEIDGVAAILDLVADGAGYAILPKHALATTTRPEAYQARPIVNPHLVSRLTLATAAGRTTTMTQQAMVELIQQVAGEVFGATAGPA
jgi:LysR family nitrogen assimilation transcriptional regulator